MSAPNAGTSGLFQGTRFWISLEVPQRSRFKELIAKHGGQIVLMENDANIKLVDHTKKNIPAGCYSYQYVEQSVRCGQLVDLEAHRAGPSKPRAMGASNIPKKGTKSVYTLEDDQLIYDFLHPFEKEQNAPIHGNKIYQLLERRFPKHPWQSSRSRYLKKLRGNPRPGGGIPRPDLLRSEPQAERQAEAPIATAASKGAAPSTRTRSPTRNVPSVQPNPTQSSSSNPPLDKQARAKRKHSAAHESSSVPEASPSKKRIVAVSQSTRTIPQDSPRRPRQSISRPSGPTTNTPPPPQRSNEPSTQELNQGVDTLFLELPFLPSPVGSTDPIDEGNDGGGSESEDDKMINWVEAQVSRGVDDAVIDDALCCTNLNCELAERVLNILAAGNPIPDDISGVWTAEDDEALEGQDARSIKRVFEKHGEHSLDERWKYLSAARERGMV